MVNLLDAANFQLLINSPHTGAQNDPSAEDRQRNRFIYHPYIKQLYEKVTYRNGTIIKSNIGNDPVTIWSFLDIGEQLRHGRLH